MSGIDPFIMVHKLNVDLDYRLVKQKRRTYAPEIKKSKNCFKPSLFEMFTIWIGWPAS